MNFRAFLLFLGVFLSVLSHRSCYIENVEAVSGPNPSSNDQNNPQDENEKSNEGLSDLSTSTRSILSTQVTTLSSPSSSSSSSSSYLITDTESESIATSSSEQTISSSELEQLVLPTIAPATPHFDTESSISSSLSVILSVTETINQEKKPIENEKQQHDSVLMSSIESERKEIEINQEKENVSENVGDKPIEDNVQDEIPEKPQEHQSQELMSEPQGKEKGVDRLSSVSVFKDNKEVTEDDIKNPKDEEDETKRKEDKPKDREDDSITAELKQAEEETKPASEEMPSFDEFKRQHLQEEEKQKNILKQQKEVKVGPETFSKPKTRKIKERKQNNYASLDCGAKILKANTEASNIFSILQDNRDMYMLNPCSTKIWFIVELCDNVQVKTIEIANFELFSSTPESFKVYVSGRYPTREWTLLGTFQARDERNLQSFPLDEPIYAKYIKVEMLSHFGSEHYCPLSLFRVFGISMMEELEDHEAGGQDDGDAVDHDDDVAQVLPPDPSVKEEDKATKSTTNILATVGDTLFNIVKVAAKKLTGVIDCEKNLMSDNLGVSTVAPSSGIVSSVTRKGKDAKPSIVTLIPSDDEDDKIHGRKHENITNSDTSFTNNKKREGLKETKQENTTFYNKIHSDSSSGPTTSSAAFTSCELLVRMLGQTGFGCMMGNVLYSKRKNSGFTPREDGPKRQKPKAPSRSHSRSETTTNKEKEDSKKNDEEKEREEESGKVEEKGKKSGKGSFDNGNKEPSVQKEDNKISSKSVNELNEKGSSVETKKSSDVNTEEASINNVQTSINRSTDPVSMVKPSEMQPTIMKPCDPTPDEKGTPLLSSVSVLNTQPSSYITQSKMSQSTDMGVEPTLNQAQKARERSSETETRTATDDNPYIQPDVKDEVNVGERVRKDVDGESTTSKEENFRSSTTSTVEQSDIRDTCASVDSSDNLLIKPSQSTSPSECKAPSATGSKDVDVLEFKILDSAGREGTAHLETLDEPDKPVKPDEPINGEQPTKESKEKDKIDQSDSTSVSDSATSSTLNVSDKDESVVSLSSSSVEPSKPSMAVVPAATTEPLEPEQPTTPPDVNTTGESESISPLSPPPVEVPLAPPTSTIEASLTDDISSVLNKVPNSAGVGGQGLASSGTQKESIFMRLTNRIKALEQNLTLSTLYMEKLNQKYRKIVEEMQKNFDKKVNLLTNATRKAEAVIKHQKEQISNLQDKTDKTSRDMKQFNRRLESLNIQVMERHIIGLFLEVILIMILFVVFRRWDRARIRRDVLRESQMNGRIFNSYDYSSHTESNALGRILNGQLSGREQLRRSFTNPSEPESIGTFGSESMTHTQKDEFSPLLDAKKKRNRKRPKSVVLSSETSQPSTVSEPTNQPSPNSIVSVTAGLLFSPARGLLNGFKRSQSLDDCQSNQKTSLPATSRLKKTKSLNVIPENSEQMSASFSFANTKKGSRIPTPPPPPPTQKYWTAGSTDGLYQKPGQQPSSLKLTQKKGRGLNGANPYT